MSPEPNRAAAGGLRLRPAGPDDAAAVLACQNTVFGEGGSAPRSLAWWRWKFLANPAGHGLQMIAETAAGEVVGVYGALPVSVAIAGRRARGAQCVDHCVRGEWLRHGGDDGLFAQLGRAFLDRWLGLGAAQAMFVYGLPVSGWRSGARHLGWQIVRDWDVTFRELPPGAAARATPCRRAVRVVPRFGTEVDRLFEQLAPGLGLATVRDHRYLNWRYADHPDRRYVLFECRDGDDGPLCGVAVYGRGDLVRPNTGFLTDWMHPVGDDDTMTAMLAAVEARAIADGTGLVCSVWNPMDPRFLAMQDHGYRVRGTPWFLTVVSARYDAIFFREKWYFTLGDSDLV